MPQGWTSILAAYLPDPSHRAHSPTSASRQHQMADLTLDPMSSRQFCKLNISFQPISARLYLVDYMSVHIGHSLRITVAVVFTTTLTVLLR
jgi:hypothetical protein